MAKRELQIVEIYHEIGHAIIAYIFNEYILSFKKIILNPNDLEKIGLNQEDLAYTHLKRIGALEQERIKENEQLCVLVVGMITLGGVGGATFLVSNHLKETKEIIASNFLDKLDLTGATGDFENINQGANLYSYKLLTNGYTKESMFEIHSKLLNIIRQLFLRPEVKHIANELFRLIQNNPRDNVEIEKFQELLDEELVITLKEELIELLNVDNFGKIY